MKAKKQNSILFITTLSVYLGLVLVGATPQVLAQAALTRAFDLKIEIEVEDDLDKNPDEKALEAYSESVRKLFATAQEFTAKNANALRDGKYELNCSLALRRNDATRTTCAPGAGEPGGAFVDSFREITKAFTDDFAENFLDNKDQAEFKLILSENDFVLKTSLNLASSEIAAKTSAFYADSVAKSATEQFKTSASVIKRNTDFSAENNQVFIVTRLPRASIEENPAPKTAK